MRSIYRVLFLLFALTSSNSFSQEVILKINAPHYENELVYLWFEDDYFSRHKTLIAQARIENSEAVFSLYIDGVTKVSIGIDYQVGSLFLDANRDYEVVFPAPDSDENRTLAWNTRVDLFFIDFPEDDINLQIGNFNKDLDEEIVLLFSDKPSLDSTNSNVRKLSHRERLKHYLDYMATWDSVYIKNDSPFFNAYRTYTGASIAYSFGQKRIDLYNSFLKNKPVLYNNPEYAQFFNEYFQNYLDTYVFYPLSEKRESAFASSNVCKDLKELLKEDSNLVDEQFEELILLKSLYDYYPKHSSLDSIIASLILTISDSSQYDENRIIAKNFLNNLTATKKGSPFPEIEFINRLGDTLLLSEFQGQLIYLQIFASWSSSSMAELELINELNKKYNSNVRFVSLSIDPDKRDFESFLAKNRKFKWEFGWIGVHPDILEVLSIYDLPLFYLIADDYSIVDWPSLWPSTGIEKVFYDEILREKEEKKFRFWEDQTNKSKREE